MVDIIDAYLLIFNSDQAKSVGGQAFSYRLILQIWCMKKMGHLFIKIEGIGTSKLQRHMKIAVFIRK